MRAQTSKSFTRVTRWLGVTFGVLSLVACGTAETEPTANGPGNAGQGGSGGAASPTAHFEPATLTDGPRLWLDVVLNEHEDATVQLWAAELGSVFGYSVHLEYDPNHLVLDETAGPQIDLSVFTADGQDNGLSLIVTESGDVGLGAMRRSPALSEVQLNEPIQLATVAFKAQQPAQSELRLTRIVVREASGEYVAVQAGGGVLKTVGGAP